MKQFQPISFTKNNPSSSSSSCIVMFSICLLFLFAVLDHTEAARRSLTGCAAFGHSCFGAHGKRALAIANGPAGDDDDGKNLEDLNDRPSSIIRDENEGPALGAGEDEQEAESTNDNSAKQEDKNQRDVPQFMAGRDPGGEHFRLLLPSIVDPEEGAVRNNDLMLASSDGFGQLQSSSSKFPSSISVGPPRARINELAAMLSNELLMLPPAGNAMDTDDRAQSYVPARKGFYDYLTSKDTANNVSPLLSRNNDIREDINSSPAEGFLDDNELESYIAGDYYRQHIPQFYRHLKRHLFFEEGRKHGGDDGIVLLGNPTTQYHTGGIFSKKVPSRPHLLGSGPARANLI